MNIVSCSCSISQNSQHRDANNASSSSETSILQALRQIQTGTDQEKMPTWCPLRTCSERTRSTSNNRRWWWWCQFADDQWVSIATRDRRTAFPETSGTTANRPTDWTVAKRTREDTPHRSGKRVSGGAIAHCPRGDADPSENANGAPNESGEFGGDGFAHESETNVIVNCSGGCKVISCPL